MCCTGLLNKMEQLQSDLNERNNEQIRLVAVKHQDPNYLGRVIKRNAIMCSCASGVSLIGLIMGAIILGACHHNQACPDELNLVGKITLGLSSSSFGIAICLTSLFWFSFYSISLRSRQLNA